MFLTRRPRLRALAALSLAAIATAGCTSIHEHRGFIADPVLISSVQPGVDNRESVQATLGRPSFTGQFDQRDWYYISRETKQLAFSRPQPTAQTVLHVRFNDAGTVEEVNRSGLELARAINPAGGATPTLGSHRSFLQEIFGNIGTVSQAGTGQRGGNTPDNPQ